MRNLTNFKEKFLKEDEMNRVEILQQEKDKLKVEYTASQICNFQVLYHSRLLEYHAQTSLLA